MKKWKGISKLTRRWRRLSSTRRKRVVIALQLLVVGAAVVHIVRTRQNDPMAQLHYGPLLNTIAKGESDGNYNAHYGNAGNTATVFTAMSIGQVLAWQGEYAKQGHPSNAVGRYQFMQSTLAGLVSKLKLDPDTRFDPAMQDRLAIALLHRRGLREYVHGKTTRDHFAHNLSKEWAALPTLSGPNPQAGYYDGDGLNKVRITPAEILGSIDALQ